MPRRSSAKARWSPATVEGWRIDPEMLGAPPRKVWAPRQWLPFWGVMFYVFMFLGAAAGLMVLGLGVFLTVAGLWATGAVLQTFAGLVFVYVGGQGVLRVYRMVSGVTLSRVKSTAHVQLIEWRCALARVAAIDGDAVSAPTEAYRASAKTRHGSGVARLRLPGEPERFGTLSFDGPPLGIGDEVTVLVDPNGDGFVAVRTLDGLYLEGPGPG